MPLNALMMPTTVPNSPTKGAVEPIVARPLKPALHFGVHDGDRAVQAALGGFDHFRFGHLRGGGLKFREPRRHYLGDMALLVALGDGDRFVEFAFAQRTGHLLHEDARLLSRRAVHQRAVDHHAQRPRGQNKENEHHRLGDNAHAFPTSSANPRFQPATPAGSTMKQLSSQPYGLLLLSFAHYRPRPSHVLGPGPKPLRLAQSSIS